jgi:hypothetical protein
MKNFKIIEFCDGRNGDYFNDLNDCQEMEKHIPLKKWNQYIINLARVIAGAKKGEKAYVPTNILVSASSSHRAEAFYRTLISNE